MCVYRLGEKTPTPSASERLACIKLKLRVIFISVRVSQLETDGKGWRRRRRRRSKRKRGGNRRKYFQRLFRGKKREREITIHLQLYLVSAKNANLLFCMSMCLSHCLSRLSLSSLKRLHNLNRKLNA